MPRDVSDQGNAYRAAQADSGDRWLLALRAVCVGDGICLAPGLCRLPVGSIILQQMLLVAFRGGYAYSPV